MLPNPTARRACGSSRRQGSQRNLGQSMATISRTRSTAHRGRLAAAAAPATGALSIPDVLVLDRADLVAIWAQLHGAPPPRSISQPLLRRILAFDLQLTAAGGWPDGLEARLAKVSTNGARAKAPEPVAGGRFLREWNGTTHVVDITESGYQWNGRTWRSLSVIAREITGAHWSGPRFFGLKEDGKVDKKHARREGRNRSAASVPTKSAAHTNTVRRKAVQQ